MSEMSMVRVEHHERVVVITIDRPAVRNAVDGPTADALAEASPRSMTIPPPMSQCSRARAARSAPAPISRPSPRVGATE